MPGSETPRGKIRVQIPGYAWEEVLKEGFLRDNQSWFERRILAGGKGQERTTYVAYLDPGTAHLVASALEVRAPLARYGNVGWALRRAAIRIEADIKVMGDETW